MTIAVDLGRKATKQTKLIMPFVVSSLVSLEERVGSVVDGGLRVVSTRLTVGGVTVLCPWVRHLNYPLLNTSSTQEDME